MLFINVIHHTQSSTSIKRLGVTRNRWRQKTIAHRKADQGYNVLINCKPKAIWIVGQSIVFCKQRNPQCSCVRKKTVNIGIFITFRNGDRKIMQPPRMTSGTTVESDVK